jgi:NitT/TauT family transport system ATP-binding protein
VSAGGSIQLESIGVDFQLGGGRQHRVLQDIDLSVASGEFICLLGASGCGKTTLLNVAAGLIAATRGTVTINGKALSDDANRHQLAYVFQDPRLLPWRTAQANAEFGLEALETPRDERRRRARAALELVGLDTFADAFPAQLSGGMRSRVALARALAIEPSVLLMDEPFGALDAITRAQLQLELRKIKATTAVTIVIVTHSIEEAIFLGDRVMVMSSHPARIREIVDTESIADFEAPGFAEAVLRLRDLLVTAPA